VLRPNTPAPTITIGADLLESLDAIVLDLAQTDNLSLACAYNAGHALIDK
jgi:hypothetical protein